MNERYNTLSIFLTSGLFLAFGLMFLSIYVPNSPLLGNYYSGNEAGRMRWVSFSFCTSLVVGIGALITSVFMSTAVALEFTVVFDLFYTFFAIRFISYAARFNVIEEAKRLLIEHPDKSL